MDALLGSSCPCGSDKNYGACCGPLHHGESQAASAEALMRSRYSAFVCRDIDYLFRTWHPKTRPEDVTFDPEITWVGLEVIDVVAGGPDDVQGEVEFKSRYESAGDNGTLHERSTFERRAGRWFYLDSVPTEID